MSRLKHQGRCRALHLGLAHDQGTGERVPGEQLSRAGEPPQDHWHRRVSVRKGQQYRIVVSEPGQTAADPGFDGPDRSQASLERFYQWLGPNRCRQRVELAVMDMWEPFAAATVKHVPKVAILYDKFHVVQHLKTPLDEVRRSEYARLSSDRERRFIKGQRYTLLSRRAHLSYRGRCALKLLLAGEQAFLQVAYLLKESF